ncbi:MAG: hypothetical protein K0R58_1787 [Ramlibacter sp.]|nr:hypothetical protein [Ramlibacter sp.]
MGFSALRLEGEYGLADAGLCGNSACNGLRPMNEAPWWAAVSQSRRKSPKSPMPQLRDERSAYSWMVQPHQRSPSRSPGATKQARGAMTTRQYSWAGAPSSESR